MATEQEIYNEQQARLRSMVPAGTKGAEELARQGFSATGNTVSNGALTEALYRVPTGSVGPDGPVFDVFAGGQHIKDPSDPRLKGVDIAGLPEGKAPSDFVSRFLPTDDKESGAISDTSKQRNEIKKTAQGIKDMASDFGINSPTAGVSATVQQIIDGVKARQTDLDKREAEDVSSIEKSFDTGEEELRMAQEEEKSRREGRTRIGGFIVKSEIEDLEKMNRQHRLEVSALTSQKQSAIRQAQRAYMDQDYQLAQTLLSTAKDIETQEYQKNQDYVRNLMAVNQMQTPITRANEAMQTWAINSMSKYPSGFGDMEPEDLINVTPAEIQRRILRSDEYKKEMTGATEFSVQEIDGQKIRFGFDKTGKVVSKVNLGSSGTGAGTITYNGAGVAPGGTSPKGSPKPASNPEADQIASAVRNLRFSSVEEAKRIQNNVNSLLNKGDIKGAEDELRSFGYQKLQGTQKTDYDLYDNTIAAFESALGQIDDSSISAGPYKALYETAKPWLKMKKDKKYVDLKSTIELGQAQLRKGFYGTAVTGTEAANAKNFLIEDSDDINTIKWKLENSANFLKFINDAQVARAIGLPKPPVNVYVKPKDKSKAEVDIKETITANKGENREKLIKKLIPVFKEFTQDEIASYVYTLIPDKK